MSDIPGDGLHPQPRQPNSPDPELVFGVENKENPDKPGGLPRPTTKEHQHEEDDDAFDYDTGMECPGCSGTLWDMQTDPDVRLKCPACGYTEWE